MCQFVLHVVEWRVGYEEEGDDLLPSVTVGVGVNASHAEVLNGKILIGQETTLNLSDVRAVQKKAFQRENRDRNFLNVEPGRFMYHSWTARSRSHKESPLPGPKVALKRMCVVIF